MCNVDNMLTLLILPRVLVLTSLLRNDSKMHQVQILLLHQDESPHRRTQRFHRQEEEPSEVVAAQSNEETVKRGNKKPMHVQPCWLPPKRGPKRGHKKKRRCSFVSISFACNDCVNIIDHRGTFEPSFRRTCEASDDGLIRSERHSRIRDCQGDRCSSTMVNGCCCSSTARFVETIVSIAEGYCFCNCFCCFP